MTKFVIEVDDQGVTSALQQLVGRMQDLSPAMLEISETMASHVEEAFQDEADPSTGQKWAPLTALTVKLRGGSAHPILQRSGQLAASIQTDHGSDFAAVGTNKVYAAVHQFGAAKGQFGVGRFKKLKGMFPIPWGGIPARPYLGISPAASNSILETLSRFLAK